jgi:hypothetical protein
LNTHTQIKQSAFGPSYNSEAFVLHKPSNKLKQILTGVGQHPTYQPELILFMEDQAPDITATES